MIMYTQQCVESSSAHRGECVTTGGLYRPTHLCVVHFELHKEQKTKKVHCFFVFFALVMVRLGGCLERGGDGPCFRR